MFKPIGTKYDGSSKSAIPSGKKDHTPKRSPKRAPFLAKNALEMGKKHTHSILEPGMMYFPTKRGAKEPQNPQNHRVVSHFFF